MAEVVNLRMARKARTRAKKAREAEAARIVHGETKQARAARKAEEERAGRTLDGAKRERD